VRTVKKSGCWLFLATLAVYGATAGGSMATDIMTYEVTKGIVESGSVAMSGNIFNMDAHRGVDGRYYAPYGIGHAVYSIPFYLGGRLAERMGGGGVIAKQEALRKAGFVVGSAFAAALTVWVAFLFAWRLTGNVPAAIRTAIALGFGTMLWPYAKFGFSAPLGALCATFGTYGIWVGIRSRRRAMLMLGGAGLGAALLVRHELILLCLPVAIWIMAESEWKWRRWLEQGLLAALPVFAAIALTLYYNDVRFGNPLDSGYLRDATVEEGSFPAGLAGLLFSPGGSLFVYSPVLIAGCAALASLGRRDRRTAWLFAGNALVLMVFYASFAHWDADRSYGPRYLLPAIPFLVLPLAHWFTLEKGSSKRRLLSAAVALSVLVQVPGVLVDFTKVGYSSEVRHFTWHQRTWTWAGSELALNMRAVTRAVPRNARYLARGERPALSGPKGDARDFSEQFAFSLDLWWIYLFYLRVFSAPVSIGLGAACLGTAALFAWQLRRQSREAQRQVQPRPAQTARRDRTDTSTRNPG
jgi:hypothetical protein